METNVVLGQSIPQGKVNPPVFDSKEEKAPVQTHSVRNGRHVRASTVRIAKKDIERVLQAQSMLSKSLVKTTARVLQPTGDQADLVAVVLSDRYVNAVRVVIAAHDQKNDIQRVIDLVTVLGKHAEQVKDAAKLCIAINPSLKERLTVKGKDMELAQHIAQAAPSLSVDELRGVIR